MEIFGENEPQTQVETLEVIESNPLKLNLPDNVFVNTLDKKIEESRRWFASKKDLYKRREKNLEYYLGQQIANLEKKNEIADHKSRYLDNLIWEGEGTLKPVALSRVPDLIAKPGNKSEESKETAERVTEVINNRMRKRETRTVLGKAYRHRPIYFTAIIKCRWDPEKGRLGDYVYENIHPDNIDVDHTASSNKEEFDWIAHHYELSVREILMRWPRKRAELYREIDWVEDNRSEETKLATKLRITEVWYTWYEKKEDKWERIEGVAWKYKKLVFDNIKNPYWDWEGEEILFTHDPDSLEKRKVGEDELRQSLLMGAPLNLTAEKTYFNHFQNPRKPFIFLGYEQLGMQPYDETSRIEQAIPLEDSVNKRGQQITTTAGKSHGTDIYSAESGLKKADVEALDPTDPDESVYVTGDVTKVHKNIPGPQVNPAWFQEQAQNRERGFSMLGTNAALRGVRQGPDPATKTQLFKESDYTRIDDEVEEVVNYAAEQMADWAMQFIKLFYTEEHMIHLIGIDGSITFQKIDRDFIEDGMEVEVSASAVDKLRRRQEAKELARTEMIDPLTFFKDMDLDDPEGRTEKLLMFNAEPALYYETYGKGREGVAGVAGALGEQPVPGGPLAGPPAVLGAPGAGPASPQGGVARPPGVL